MLNDSSPTFLEELDSNPQYSMQEFYVFVVKLLKSHPPGILQSMQEEDREEFYHEFFMHCCKNGFEKLKKYRNIGKPFASWLLTAAWHFGIDKYKKRKWEIPVEDISMVAGGNPTTKSSQDILLDDIVRECLANLSERCQLLLKAWAVDGMSLEEIRRLIGFPPGEKFVKRVWDEIHRSCKVKLLKCLKKNGISEGFAVS